jgi:hypothetical protein
VLLDDHVGSVGVTHVIVPVVMWAQARLAFLCFSYIILSIVLSIILSIFLSFSHSFVLSIILSNNLLSFGYWLLR